MRTLRTSLRVVTCAFMTACGASTIVRTADVGVGPASRSDLAVSQYNVIRQDEIRARSFQTAYDAVVRLRPRYLSAGHNGAAREAARPAVIIDRGVPEPIDALKQIQADAVLEIRFVEPADAETRFGVQYTGGIVLVRLVARAPQE